MHRERELAAILDESLDEMYLFDFETLHFLEVNRGARENLGYSMEELSQLTPLDLKPDFSPKTFDELLRPLRNGETNRLQFETRHRRKDGSFYPVEVFLQIFPFRGSKAFTAMILDITERKRADDEQQKLMAELELRNIEMERFTYTVSHDLKSPLITIRGFIDLLERDLEAGDQGRVREDAAEIRAAASRMHTLLSDLLALSRVGRVLNPLESVSLEELVRDACSLLAGPIEQRGVVIDVQPDLPRVDADRQRMGEVVQNLIENAIKFMGDQEKPRIDVSARAVDDEVVLAIRDNGIGIPHRHRERIFGLFERLESGAEGSGVGLPLVERIVKAHGGRVWVESEGAGKGSCFKVALERTGSLT